MVPRPLNLVTPLRILHRFQPPPAPHWRCLLAAAVVVVTPLCGANAEPFAFPGAEGFGRFAAGGRGGDVYPVTNLDDSGPGSLRDAVSVGHRTVVFRVSGVIDLRTTLVISTSHLTIAGQTAPGDGICLRRHSLRIDGANDVIVRHLRVRPGPESGRAIDGIEVRRSHDIILDHCSVSWTIDEAMNTWHDTRNLTVQWCLIAEPLHRSTHPKGPHAYGASWGGVRASYHHNLFAHCTARSPSVAGQATERTVLMDHRCSVIFNWEHRSCDGKPESINVVNNYYKPGPATRDEVRRRLVLIDDTKARYGYDSRWFIAGNVLEGDAAISADNWRGVEHGGDTSEAANRAREPFPVAPVTTQSAADAYALVLRDAGATRPRRDAVDARIAREVETGRPAFGSGIIDRPEDVGGWPQLCSTAAPADTDDDGMPDDWERTHGLDPGNPADRNGHTIDAEYTTLEVYLASLAAS